MASSDSTAPSTPINSSSCPTPTRLLRRREVEACIGLSRSTIYALVAAGDFPRPVKLGPRAVAWVASEVSDWIHSRVAARENGGPQ